MKQDLRWASGKGSSQGSCGWHPICSARTHSTHPVQGGYPWIMGTRFIKLPVPPWSYRVSLKHFDLENPWPTYIYIYIVSKTQWPCLINGPKFSCRCEFLFINNIYYKLFFNTVLQNDFLSLLDLLGIGHGDETCNIAPPLPQNLAVF